MKIIKKILMILTFAGFSAMVLAGCESDTSASESSANVSESSSKASGSASESGKASESRKTSPKSSAGSEQKKDESNPSEPIDESSSSEPDNQEKPSEPQKTYESEGSLFVSKEYDATGNVYGDSYYIFSIKNTSDIPLQFDILADAKDKNGNFISRGGLILDYVAPGETTFADIKFDGFTDVANVDCEVLVNEAIEDLYSNFDKLENKGYRSGNSVIAALTNKGNNDATFPVISCTFYDADNNIVYYESKEAEEVLRTIRPGDTYYVQFASHVDFDHYELHSRAILSKSDIDFYNKVYESNKSFTMKDFIYNGENMSTSLLVVKNNSDKDVSAKANAVAYDENGNIIGAADGVFEVIGKGEEAATEIGFPDTKNISRIDYYLSCTNEPFNKAALKDLTFNVGENGNGFSVTAKNNGKIDASQIRIYFVFYKDNQITGIDNYWIPTLEAGTSHTSVYEYDKEKFDRYECYYDAYGELVSN